MKQLRIIRTVIALSLSFLFVHQQTFAASVITVQMNGQPLSFDQAPLLENGRVLVPVRTVFEAVGAQVEWKSDTSTVVAYKGDVMITIPLNNHYALINGAQKSLDVPAKSVNGRTLVPLRFVGESLGCEVAWDSKRHLVTIKQIVRANELPPEETIPVTDTTIVPDVPGEIVPSDKPLFD